MEENQKYSLYNQVSIYELRNLAREKGVRCPSKKKKLDLINEIIQIDNGSKQPYIKTTNQGRPLKKTLNIDINKIIKEKESSLTNIEDKYLKKLIGFLNDYKNLNFNIYCIISKFIEEHKEFLKNNNSTF